MLNFRRFAPFALLGLCILSAIAEAAQISIGPNVQISRAHPGDAHYEVYAAADPKDPLKMLAASFIYPQDGSEGQTILYATKDGGNHWEPVLEGKVLENTSDPALAYGPDGSAYYVVALVPSIGPRSMLLFRSPDGQSWGTYSTLTYMDREYIAVDNTAGKYRGRIYVHGNNRIPPGVSDIVTFFSSDQGRHFVGPVKRSGFGKFTATEMGNAVVSSEGTLIAVFVQADEQSKRGVLCAISSTDGGESFTDAVPISDYIAGGNRKGTHNNVNSLPALAIDSSHGPFRDRLYAVWPDRRSGHSEIYFSSSADRGKTWSKVRVISDNPENDLTDQSMPEVAVNRDGVVGVIWSDRRNHRDNLGWDIRFTASTDGGETFAPSVPVSEAGANFDDKTFWGPLRPAVARAATRPGEQELSIQLALSNFLFIGGDTWGLMADAAGTFHPVWSDNHSGAAQLWTASVTVHSGESKVAGVPRSSEMVRFPKAVGRNDTPAVKFSLLSTQDLVNLTSVATIELTHPFLDRGSGILSVNARVINRSSGRIRGPFAVQVRSLSSSLADVSVEGAASESAANHMAWMFDDAELEPEGASASRQIRFHLSNFRPFHDGDRYRLGILDLKVSVLGTR